MAPSPMMPVAASGKSSQLKVKPNHNGSGMFNVGGVDEDRMVIFTFHFLPHVWAMCKSRNRISVIRRHHRRHLDVVDELRALVTQQQSALAAREERKRAVRETATSSAAQTDAGESAEERRLRARCAELEDSLVAEREATRIAKVVCETLQRKASRAEDAAADARAAAEAYRTKTSSLERIVDHLEAMVQEKRDVAQSLDESARRRVSYATAPPQAPA